LEVVPDTIELSSDFLTGDNVAIRLIAKIQFNSRTKEPIERHLIDSDRCIHVNAVVRRHADYFKRPAFPVREVFLT
jgi:hypothetical protein